MTLDQPALFDAPATVRAAVTDGIERADRHADPSWKIEARRVVEWCIDNLPTWTADDVWSRIRPVEQTRNPSALGPVILEYARAHRIVKTGHMPLSKYARRHRNLTEWTKRP